MNQDSPLQSPGPGNPVYFRKPTYKTVKKNPGIILIIVGLCLILCGAMGGDDSDEDDGLSSVAADAAAGAVATAEEEDDHDDAFSYDLRMTPAERSAAGSSQEAPATPRGDEAAEVT